MEHHFRHWQGASSLLTMMLLKLRLGLLGIQQVCCRPGRMTSSEGYREPSQKHIDKITRSPRTGSALERRTPKPKWNVLSLGSYLLCRNGGDLVVPYIRITTTHRDCGCRLFRRRFYHHRVTGTMILLFHSLKKEVSCAVPSMHRVGV